MLKKCEKTFPTENKSYKNTYWNSLNSCIILHELSMYIVLCTNYCLISTIVTVNISYIFWGKKQKHSSQSDFLSDIAVIWFIFLGWIEYTL